MGTNSIGWCAVTLDADKRPSGVLDAGVRILTPNDEAGKDPKSKTSLAANRRDARSARRRRDRFLRRRDRLMSILIESGLMPRDKDERKKLEKIDPYWLRCRALDHRLDLFELGRALFHINQRRGFKSNRISDADNNEKSAMKQGAQALKEKIVEEQEFRTLGEFLANRHRRDKEGYRIDREGNRIKKSKDDNGGGSPSPVRFRPTSKGSKNLYDFYPTRELVEQEIDCIWTEQKVHYPDILTEQLLEKIRETILEQRPLKPQIVGRCTLRPDENKVFVYQGIEIDMGERTPKAHPLFQKFRILQDVCQLRLVRPGSPERFLTLPQRDALVAVLERRQSRVVAFEALRKALQLPDGIRFNYEGLGRDGFQSDQTASKLRAKNSFGKAWDSLTSTAKDEIIECLLSDEDEERLHQWLQDKFNLKQEAAEKISDVRLPQGHGNFGRSVLRDIVRVMETESEECTNTETGEIYQRPLTYDEAVQRIDEHHSDLRPDQQTKLPYYGEVLARHVISRPSAPEGSQDRIGRVPNPTVHIGLNQLRKIINALIATYGPPDGIVVELARELKWSKERKQKENKKNKDNREANDRNRDQLNALNEEDTYANRLRLRLYHELPPDERVCIYTGEQISKCALFSDQIEIDHILPYSRTLDDGFMNKVLCTRESNREKLNQAPAEAWHGQKLLEIAERAERVIPRKAWRFFPDAMEDFEEKGGLAARHLTDTQYVSRLAKTYLEHICKRVDASPGRLTAMLRARWRLGAIPSIQTGGGTKIKNRKDHRHHAVDAFVLACTDIGLLDQISKASGRSEELNLERLFPNNSFPIPFSGYWEALDNSMKKLVVSHKPDHGIPPNAQSNIHVTSGALLEGTAYGEVKATIEGKEYNLVVRKPISELTDSEIDRVHDASLRRDLQQIRDAAKRAGHKLKEALAEFGESSGIRRIRILKTEKSVYKVEHGDGFYKLYSAGDNHRIEIYSLQDKWLGEGVTVFDANQPNFTPNWRNKHPNAELVMKVHNGDLVEADFGNGRTIYRVCSLDASANRLKLAPHYEAGSLGERHNDPDDLFRYEIKSYSTLKTASACLVRVDSIGRVFPIKHC